MSGMPPTPYLLRVTPGDPDIIEQIMFYGDSVHPIPDIQTLLEKRISGETDVNRQAYALVANVNGKRIAGATIFTHRSSADIGQSSENFLYGNIHKIKTTHAERLVGPANLMTCYSICSYTLPPQLKQFFPNPGRTLIKKLYGEFNSPDFVISTCSPIRTTQDFLKAAGQDHVDDPEILRLYVAAHLMQRQNKTPQSFHMSNGAYAGAVHANLNPAGGEDNVNGVDLTLGYRYARTEFALKANETAWKMGEVPASRSVRGLIKASDELLDRTAPKVA